MLILAIYLISRKSKVLISGKAKKYAEVFNCRWNV